MTTFKKVPRIGKGPDLFCAKKGNAYGTKFIYMLEPEDLNAPQYHVTVPPYQGIEPIDHASDAIKALEQTEVSA